MIHKQIDKARSVTTDDVSERRQSLAFGRGAFECVRESITTAVQGDNYCLERVALEREWSAYLVMLL